MVMLNARGASLFLSPNSETGGCRSYLKKLPWWYERDFGGRDVTRPAGLLDRFKQYHFDTLFGDYNTLAEETQWHQFISLKYEIESMRRHGEIQGYVVTGMTDIHWEVNGLLDMWRNPKVFAEELKKIQQPDLVLLGTPKQSFIGGEKVELQVLVSHYSSRELKGTRVRWMTDAGAGGQFEISEAIASGTVAGLQKISFLAPDFSVAGPEHLHLEIRTRQGALLAENDYNLYIFPKPQPATEIPLYFHDPLGTMPELSKSLQQAGYQMDSSLEPRDNGSFPHKWMRQSKSILLLEERPFCFSTQKMASLHVSHLRCCSVQALNSRGAGFLISTG